MKTLFSSRHLSPVFSRKTGYAALFCAVLLIMCLAAQPALAQTGMYGPPSFTKMVDGIKGAVVNLSTTRVVKTGQGFGNVLGGNFFNQFFGQIPRELKESALGSGFLIDNEGHILTNNHVIENATEIKVKFQGEETVYDAKVVGTDPKTELALIQIVGDPKLPKPAELGDSDTVSVGDWVLAMGNPFGLGATVTQGIISAEGRVIGAGPYDDFLQTDAAINPGNSGGPLFDMHGQVIGINTAIVAGGQGIGFAIPINMAKELLPQLKKGKIIRGWLGVVIQNMTPQLAKFFGLKEPKGIVIAQVLTGGPADKAGVKQGDIILTMDGKDVASTSAFSRAVAEIPPGKQVELGILRQGAEKTIPVTIGTMPETGMKPATETPTRPEEEQLGFTVQDVTPQIARALGLSPNETGVVVTQVQGGSAADDAGLEAGDLIKGANRQAITNIKDFRRVISQRKKGEGLLLLVQRGDYSLYVVIQPGGKE